MHKRPNGYWLDWDNVAKHLLELAAVHGGMIPKQEGFREAGLLGLYVTLGKQWGGIEAVRERLGFGGLKRCASCRELKKRDTDFRGRTKQVGDKVERYHDNVCKKCSDWAVTEYRNTWKGRAADLTRRARERASQWGRDFDLDKEWVHERLVQIDFKCELTHLPLEQGHGHGGSLGARNRYAASLDRIDSSRGYTKDNVRIVCARMNVARGDMTDEQLEEFAVGFLQTRGFKVTR